MNRAQRLCFSTSALCFALAACTPAQVAKVETGIPADAALIGCVVTTALASGGDVAAVAVACASDAATVAQILLAAATLKGSTSTAMVNSATAVRSTNSFRDAYYNYPQAAK